MGVGGQQIGWAPDGASVYWEDDAGKEGSRIAREPVVAGTPADERDPSKILLVDLPGKRSRERFPRLSNDGKWLVFAAAVNNLENDVDDFELFLWEAGAPATSATRLTFHSANDRWPDIFVGEAGKAPPASAPEAAEAKEGDETEGDEKGEKAEKATDGEGCCAKPKADAASEEKEPAAAAAEEAPDETAAPAASAKPKGKKKKHH
jgi:hypothetical protein